MLKRYPEIDGDNNAKRGREAASEANDEGYYGEEVRFSSVWSIVYSRFPERITANRIIHNRNTERQGSSGTRETTSI